jgi:hypothetical protein
MKKLFVAIPCYSHTVHTGCMLSLLRLDRLLRSEGIALDLYVLNGFAYIEQSRNKLASMFMDSSDADALLFIDDDVQFDEVAVLKMLRCNAEVVGGLYPYKAYHWKGGSQTLQYVVKSDRDILPDAQSDTVVEVEGVGTGLLLVRRSALLTMASTTKRYKDSRSPDLLYQFFELAIDDDQLWGEDFKFCKKWRACGGRVYVAPWAKCAHWGMHGFGLEKFSVA